MFIGQSQNSFAKKRANTLSKKPEPLTKPLGNQRSGVSPGMKAKKGYDFLPNSKSVYDLDTIKHITLLYKGLVTGGKLRLPKKDVDSETLMELERKIANVVNTISVDEEYNVSYDTVDSFAAGYQPGSWHKVTDKLNGRPAVKMLFRFKQDPPGCLMLGPIFKRKDQKMIFALALLEKFLGVYTWYQMDTEDTVHSAIDWMGEQWMYDEDVKGQAEQFDHTNYHKIKQHMFLHSLHKDISLTKLAVAEEKWNRAQSDVSAAFNRALKTPIKTIKKWLQGKSQTTCFLRGVLYLLVNQFRLEDYVDYEDDYGPGDNTQLPADQAYAMLWDCDEYLDALDDQINSRYESGLGSPYYIEWYFSDGVMKPIAKNPLHCLAVFCQLFEFHCYKNIFDEKKNYYLLANLTDVHIQQWEQFLHRAIEDYRRKLPDGVATNERRVYP